MITPTVCRYIEKGTVKFINVSEKPDDPAGDEFPESSCAEAVMDGIKELHPDLA